MEKQLLILSLMALPAWTGPLACGSGTLQDYLNNGPCVFGANAIQVTGYSDVQGVTADHINVTTTGGLTIAPASGYHWTGDDDVLIDFFAAPLAGDPGPGTQNWFLAGQATFTGTAGSIAGEAGAICCGQILLNYAFTGMPITIPFSETTIGPYLFFGAELFQVTGSAEITQVRLESASFLPTPEPGTWLVVLPLLALLGLRLARPRLPYSGSV